MKRKFFAVAVLILSSISLFAQSFLTPAAGYKTESLLSDYTSLSVYDFHQDYLYAGNASHIYCFNANTEELVKTYDVPTDAGDYPSFITISPDGATIWAGFTTSSNVDDRVYSIDVESGVWTQKASVTANFDMEFLGNHQLIACMDGFTTVISLLDVSGNNQHRNIIEVAGYVAGFAIDTEGNVYFATSIYGDNNYVYRWNSGNVAMVVADPSQPTLKASEAVILSTIPHGAYDCDVDEGGNVVFDFNEYGGEKVLAMWNGIEGHADNFTVLATSSDEVWLGVVKTRGNLTENGVGNEVITSSYGLPLAKVYRDNVGINKDITLQNTINVYPNPTKGAFKIESDTEIQSVEIYNLLGQKVYSDFSENQEYFIDLSDCVKGSYIILLQQNNQKSKKTIIIQ